MNRRSDEGMTGNALLADLERFKPADLTLNGWAVAAGVSRAIWGDIKRHGNPSRKTLEKLLTAAGSSLAEFEALRIGVPSQVALSSGTSQLADRQTAWRGQPAPHQQAISATARGEIRREEVTVPVFETQSSTGHQDFFQSGEPSRAAILVCVSNMEPRFRFGRTIIIAPNENCQPGDDVIIGLRSNDVEGGRRVYLIAHLVQQTASTLMLRQYNPPGEFTLPRSDVLVLARILGELF